MGNTGPFADELSQNSRGRGPQAGGRGVGVGVLLYQNVPGGSVRGGLAETG